MSNSTDLVYVSFDGTINGIIRKQDAQYFLKYFPNMVALKENPFGYGDLITSHYVPNTDYKVMLRSTETKDFLAKLIPVKTPGKNTLPPITGK